MQLINVSKIYHNKNNDVIALKDINLSFSRRGMTFIIGASGCGKTTLLNIIAGYDQDYEGTLETDGKVESIEQEIMLMENMSVFDNLLLVSDDKERINALLDRFQLKEKNKKVKKLSVGEKKRVQIIRSLLTKASYLICDEPTAALDHENGERVMEMLKEISKEIGVIVVTHDIALVEAYSDRVIRMGKGCIIEDETIISNDDPVKDISEKRSIRKQAELLIKLVKTRWQEVIFQYGLLFLTVIILFVVTFLFPSLNSTMNATSNWLNGKNILMSEPNEGNRTYRSELIKHIRGEEKASGFLYYDLFNREDVYLARDNISGILGYRIGWDPINFLASLDTSFSKITNIEGLRKAVEMYKKEYEQTGIQPYPQFLESMQILAQYDEEYPDDRFPKDEYIFVDYTPFIGFRKNLESTLPMILEEYVSSKYYSVNVAPYQLFSETTIDLAYGKMPIKENEILLTKTIASDFMNAFGLSSLEDLVGHELTFAINAYGFEHQSYSFVVSGITYMESIVENQVFLRKES